MLRLASLRNATGYGAILQAVLINRVAEQISHRCTSVGEKKGLARGTEAEQRRNQRIPYRVAGPMNRPDLRFLGFQFHQAQQEVMVNPDATWTCNAQRLTLDAGLV